MRDLATARFRLVGPVNPGVPGCERRREEVMATAGVGAKDHALVLLVPGVLTGGVGRLRADWKARPCVGIGTVTAPVWIGVVVSELAESAPRAATTVIPTAYGVMDEACPVWNVQMSRLLMLSSTAASRNSPPSSVTARPKAPPGGRVDRNCPRNAHRGVNSTSSLGWVGSVLTASPLAAMRSPFGASARPSGPW